MIVHPYNGCGDDFDCCLTCGRGEAEHPLYDENGRRQPRTPSPTMVEGRRR